MDNSPRIKRTEQELFTYMLQRSNTEHTVIENTHFYRNGARIPAVLVNIEDMYAGAEFYFDRVTGALLKVKVND